MMRRRHKSASPRINQQAELDPVIQSLLQWYLANRRDLPWRKTSDPYAIWISESMLQQTQVQTVIPYYERWMKRVPDVTSLSHLSEEDGLKLWEGLGYYNRMRNLIRAAGEIRDHHGGSLPSSYAELIQLPGIGPYTAGAICSIAFNLPEPILDGNVVRILTRFYGITTPAARIDTRKQLTNLARQWVSAASTFESIPGRRCSELNQAMMELGACVCSPRAPECQSCPIQLRCEARATGKQSSIPKLKRRTPARQRRLIVLLLRRGEKYWIEQRAKNSHNSGFWQFAEMECDLAGTLVLCKKIAGRFSRSKGSGPPQFLAKVRHTITHNAFELLAFESRMTSVPGDPAGVQGTWVTWRELDSLPFSSAHRKILKKIRQDKKPCPRP